MINQHFRKRFSLASITACCMTKVLGKAVAVKWFPLYPKVYVFIVVRCIARTVSV